MTYVLSGIGFILIKIMFKNSSSKKNIDRHNDSTSKKEENESSL